MAGTLQILTRFTNRVFSPSCQITRVFSASSSMFAMRSRWNPKPDKPPIDRWDEKHALFGENDFKDILGDGSYNLKNNVTTGPYWMRGWRGSELERLVRKKKVVGHKMGPFLYHEMNKRIRYLLKKMNRNRGTGKTRMTQRRPYEF